MLFLALSCLQGRGQLEAFNELLALSPDGIQLTPGNSPSEGFCDALEASGLPWATHQGYTPLGRRARVWSEDGELVGTSTSIHPPKAQHHAVFFEQMENGDLDDQVLEVMYPGYCLGHRKDIERAMEVGIPLAIDISHLYIQLKSGTNDSVAIDRLLNYENIHEIHVSCNNGVRDSHSPISESTYMLGWARERHQENSMLVLESYMHRMTTSERQRQVDLIKNYIN